MDTPDPTQQHGRQFATHMDDAVREQLLQQQNECTFIWQARHEATGTVMSYLWADGCVWLTTNDRRPRIQAIRQHGRAAVVISSAGTGLGQSRCVTLRGPCQILDDEETRAWFFPQFCARVFPDNVRAQATLHNLLDRPGQVILRLQPDRITSYDGDALMRKIAST